MFGDEIQKKLEKHGISGEKVKSLLKADLGDYFDKIIVGIEKGVAEYTSKLDYVCSQIAGPGWKSLPNVKKLMKEMAEYGWTEYKEFMSRPIYDLHVKAAEQAMFPGLKEGHQRIPTMEDCLAGKSGYPIQDIGMLMLQEASKTSK